MTKAATALALALLTIIPLAACGGNDSGGSDADPVSQIPIVGDEPAAISGAVSEADLAAFAEKQKKERDAIQSVVSEREASRDEMEPSSKREREKRQLASEINEVLELLARKNNGVIEELRIVRNRLSSPVADSLSSFDKSIINASLDTLEEDVEFVKDLAESTRSDALSATQTAARASMNAAEARRLSRSSSDSSPAAPQTSNETLARVEAIEKSVSFLLARAHSLQSGASPTPTAVPNSSPPKIAGISFNWDSVSFSKDGSADYDGEGQVQVKWDAPVWIEGGAEAVWLLSDKGGMKLSEGYPSSQATASNTLLFDIGEVTGVESENWMVEFSKILLVPGTSIEKAGATAITDDAQIGNRWAQVFSSSDFESAWSAGTPFLRNEIAPHRLLPTPNRHAFENAGETKALAVSVYQSDGAANEANNPDALRYSSSNSNIVSVDENGVMYSLRNGSATITIEYDSVSAQVAVTVGE